MAISLRSTASFLELTLPQPERIKAVVHISLGDEQSERTSALKTTASDVLLLGSHLLTDKSSMTVPVEMDK
jgi:hypothetical protein